MRLDGLTVGEGDAYRPDADTTVDQPGAPIDLISLLRPATERAMQSVRSELKNAHLKALAQQPKGSRKPEMPKLADIASRLLIDVQLGHHLQRIRLAPDAELAATLSHFAPGYHGLVSPVGQSDYGTAIVWPATALARRTLPRAQLARLLDDRGRKIHALVELGRPGGLPLQRFEVVHLVRPQRHMPVVHLVRGNVVLPPRNISSRTLDGMVTRLVRHLKHHFTEDHVVRGTYYPTADRYDPPVAHVRDAGLACYALMSYAKRRSQVAGVNDAETRQVADISREAAVRLGKDLLNQKRPAHPAATGLVLLTLLDDVEPGSHKDLRDGLADQLLKMYDSEQGGFLTLGDNGRPTVAPPAANAVATAALAVLYKQTRDEKVAEVARQQMRQLWTESQRSPDVSTLPWFVLAHHRAGRLLAGDSAEATQRLTAHERGLGELVEKLVEQQVIERPCSGQPM